MKERRQTERTQVVGSAIVVTERCYVGTFLVENVSADGALLAGESQLPIDQEVRVLLQLYGARRIGLRAKIVRHAERDGQHIFALRFRPTPAVQDFLQKVALRLLEASSPITLVVEEDD